MTTDQRRRGAPVLGPDLLRTLAEVEREHTLLVVEACGHNLARAARILGIDRTTLVRKLRKWQTP